VQRTHRVYCLTFDSRGIYPSMSGPPLSSPAMSTPAKSSVNVQSCNFSQPVERWQARTCWSRDTSWPISDLSVHAVTLHARRVRLPGRIMIRFHNRLQNCLVCSRQHHLPLKPTKHLIFSPSCDLWNPHISTRASKISHRGYIVLLLRPPPP